MLLKEYVDGFEGYIDVGRPDNRDVTLRTNFQILLIYFGWYQKVVMLN